MYLVLRRFAFLPWQLRCACHRGCPLGTCCAGSVNLGGVTNKSMTQFSSHADITHFIVLMSKMIKVKKKGYNFKNSTLYSSMIIKSIIKSNRILTQQNPCLIGMKSYKIQKYKIDNTLLYRYSPIDGIKTLIIE